jgi:putative addiction module component (TIGR02574 family)
LFGIGIMVLVSLGHRVIATSLERGAGTMSMTIDELEAAALELSAEERARLAERLIASLNTDDEIESAWVEEAERRYDELRAGRDTGLPLEGFRARIQAQFP